MMKSDRRWSRIDAHKGRGTRETGVEQVVDQAPRQQMVEDEELPRTTEVHYNNRQKPNRMGQRMDNQIFWRYWRRGMGMWVRRARHFPTGMPCVA